MTSNLHRSQAAVRRIVVLAALILTVVIVGGCGLMAYTAISGDRAQLSQDRDLVSHRIETSVQGLAKWVNADAVWDAAYDNIGRSANLAWIESNMDSTFERHLGRGVALLLDARDQTLYAHSGAAKPAQTPFAAFRAAAEPLIGQIRREEAVRLAASGPPKVGFAANVPRSGVVVVAGQPYLVAASTIVPERRARPAGEGPANILVGFEPLDHQLLPSIGEDFRVRHARLEPAGGAVEAAQVSLLDVTGREVGHIAWTPKRPGADAFRHAAPAFGLAFLVLLVAGLALARRIRAILHDLRTGDAALDRTVSELVQARDEADAANVAKSQFLANISHEIRTPLNGVLGMAQVMAREELTDAQRERLNVVQESGRSLLTILNDVLDFSKIEAGRLEIDNHEFDLGEAVRAACAAFTAMAGQKGVELRIEIAPAADGLWWGDGARLRQVLNNLVSNAVKFTAAGEVAVTVAPGAGGALAFAVRDSGIGIPREQLGELFRKFTQADASTSRRFGGTGLGLSISRELVELMGGKMTVTSQPERGSTFAFELPLEKRADRAAAAPAPSPTPREPRGETVRILAAEDNATNQLILRSLLEPLGVELTIVGDGREAIEAFELGGFDLILMDVQMPVMSGVEAVAAIRAIERDRAGPAIPILALSANVMSHQVAEYLLAGMTGHVGKPIEADKLFEAIEAALAPGDAEAAETAAA